MSALPGSFQAPFTYDGILYVFDAMGEMAADFAGEGNVIRPRGWGRISALEGAEEKMGAWERWLEKVAGGEHDPDSAVAAMNKAAADGAGQ